MLDIWTSRRGNFIECEYWLKEDYVMDTNLVDFIKNPDDEIVYQREPDGVFFAKESGSYTSDNQTIAEAFMVKRESISLETSDDISRLRQNDIVKFNDKKYRVDSIQKVPFKNQRQFLANSQSFTYYLTLKG
jgi:hypothetical protein